MRGGFTYFGKDLRAKLGHDQNPSYLSNDAKHHFVLQSIADLPHNFKLDLVARYLDYIPASFATVRVNEYFTFDARFAWHYDNIEISVVGQNLWAGKHSEFGAVKIPPSLYGKIACRF